MVYPTISTHFASTCCVAIRLLRPSGSDVIRRVGGTLPVIAVAADSFLSARRSSGSRSSALRQRSAPLDDAFSAVAADGCERRVRSRPPGMGKTTLIEGFLGGHRTLRRSARAA